MDGTINPMELDDPQNTAVQSQQQQQQGQNDSEGEGDDLRPGAADDSSQEESEDDSEAERLVREGFIEDDDAGTKKSKKKKKKRKPRAQEEDIGNLDDDDLDLLEQNTGRKFDRPNRPQEESTGGLKRLRRIRDDSPASDDLDREDEVPRQRESRGDDLDIFGEEDDEDGYGYEDNMDDFIEVDPLDEDDDGGRQERRRPAPAAKGNNRRRANMGGKTAAALMGGRGALPGVSKEAWEEISEIFGNGEDYAWAMAPPSTETAPDATTLRDIFEPSQIAERMLTDADDMIRATDSPERIQILSNELPNKEAGHGLSQPLLLAEELEDARDWISSRIDPQLTQNFLTPDLSTGQYPRAREHFLSALLQVLKEMHLEFLEVPFIWMHRRDYLVFSDHEGSAPDHLLDRPHLWKVQTLSFKYRALLDRKSALLNKWNRSDLDPLEDNDYFHELVRRASTVEEVVDVSDWVNTHYAPIIRQKKQEADAMREEEEQDVIEEEEMDEEGNMVIRRRIMPKKKSGKLKQSARESRYDRAKKTIISKMVSQIAIPSQSLAVAYVRRNLAATIDDPPAPPAEFAEEYIVDELYPDASTVLSTAKMMLVTEIVKDPYIKMEFRRVFREKGVVSVKPTDKGQLKIDQLHTFYAFKYLTEKPVSTFSGQSLFLLILAAETDGLIEVKVHLPASVMNTISNQLERIYLSDLTSDVAREWNDLRSEVLDTAINQYLAPSAAQWLRDTLQEDAEDHVGSRCGQKLEERIETAPFRGHRMQLGQTPGIVAISNGAGDPMIDSTYAVWLDNEGRFREHLKLDSLRQPPAYGNMNNEKADACREQLAEFLKRVSPDAVIVGGTSSRTYDLYQDILSISDKTTNAKIVDPNPPVEDYGEPKLPILFVNDSAARLYQHSKRGSEELPDLPIVARYCVGIARFAQGPVNEYAALGNDAVSLTYDLDQRYLNVDKLRPYLERALVNVINYIGVDINKAVRNPYYARMLPFVSGLGPRKAQQLLQDVRTNGGTLVVRSDLVTRQILQPHIFMNASAFLRISQDYVKTARRDRGEDGPDVLDSTRIHSEDYEIARKMAADAEELDEEDIAALEHPSDIVNQLMSSHPQKLLELRLDDFAVELQKLMGLPKRLTLYLIREELQRPFGENRPEFRRLTDVEVFFMLTGETTQTIAEGLVVPVRIERYFPDKQVALRVRLDSGVRGFIESGRVTDREDGQIAGFLPNHVIRALVIGINYKEFQIELDCRTKPVREAAQNDATKTRRTKPDAYFDETQAAIDRAAADAKKQKASARPKRLIGHPNFHNFSAGQAEHYLFGQPRGECVIRPSSKGPDHLACTWKVLDGIYQHLDVLELDKPNDFALGRQLRIGKQSYSDLDNLITAHVRGLARQVDKMVAHDKFKGTEEETVTFMRNFQMAHPERSIYAFAIDRKTAGQFSLMFIPQKGMQPRSWPVKIRPEGFELFGTELPDMPELCNAFKIRIGNMSTGPVPQGKTPGYGTAYGQTPQHTASRTPQYVPGSGRTPNPLGGRTPQPSVMSR